MENYNYIPSKSESIQHPWQETKRMIFCRNSAKFALHGILNCAVCITACIELFSINIISLSPPITTPCKNTRDGFCSNSAKFAMQGMFAKCACNQHFDKQHLAIAIPGKRQENDFVRPIGKMWAACHVCQVCMQPTFR